MSNFDGRPTIDSRFGYDVTLVPAHEVERFRDIEAARSFLGQVTEGVESLRELVASYGFAGDLDDERVLDAAAEILASGQFVVLHSRSVTGSMVRPVDPDGDDWSHIPRLSEITQPTEPEPSWIEIRCIGIAGASFAGAAVRIELSNGEMIERRLDDRSCVRVDRIPSDGTCKLELAAGMRGRGSIPLDERPTLTTGHQPMRPGDPPKSLRTRAEHLVLVEQPHAFSC